MGIPFYGNFPSKNAHGLFVFLNEQTMGLQDPSYARCTYVYYILVLNAKTPSDTLVDYLLSVFVISTCVENFCGSTWVQSVCCLKMLVTVRTAGGGNGGT